MNHDQQGSDVLASLMHQVTRSTDAHVVIAQQMAKDEAAHRGTGTAAIVRRRRRQLQDATTVILKGQP
jgi:hypothetical protein